MFLIYSYLFTNLSFVIFVNVVLISVDWLLWCLSFFLQQVRTPQVIFLVSFCVQVAATMTVRKTKARATKKPNKINVSKMKERTKRDTERWRIVEFVDLLKEGGTMQ